MITCNFASHDLNLANNYEVTSVKALDPPKSLITKYKLVRSDGEKVTGNFYGERTITVEGRILAINQADMETKLDTLKSWLVGQDEELDINVAGGTRRFTATVTRFNTNVTGYYCTFNITFFAEPFGKDVSATTLNFGTYTSTPTLYTNTIGGSYKSYPYMQLVFNAVAPSTDNAYIQIENAVTNKRLRLTDTFNYADVIKIYGDTKKVYKYPYQSVLIDECNATTGWTSSHTLSLDISVYTSLKVVMAAPAATTNFQRLNGASIDCSATQTRAIMYVYIPTPSAGAVASLSFYIGKNATLAADYEYWTVTTDYEGNAFVLDAWNLIAFDFATAPTGTNGVPNRAAIKSISLQVNGTAATMQLNSVKVDNIYLDKQGVVAEIMDYEGTFPDLNVGSTTLIVSDEFTSRNITITGEYYKRYL